MSISVSPDQLPASPEDLQPQVDPHRLGSVAVPGPVGETTDTQMQHGSELFASFGSRERAVIESAIKPLSRLTAARHDEAKAREARLEVMAILREVTTGHKDGIPTPKDYKRTFGDGATAASVPELAVRVFSFVEEEPEDIRRIARLLTKRR